MVVSGNVGNGVYGGLLIRRNESYVLCDILLTL